MSTKVYKNEVYEIYIEWTQWIVVNFYRFNNNNNNDINLLMN